MAIGDVGDFSIELVCIEYRVSYSITHDCHIEARHWDAIAVDGTKTAIYNVNDCGK